MDGKVGSDSARSRRLEAPGVSILKGHAKSCTLQSDTRCLSHAPDWHTLLNLMLQGMLDTMFVPHALLRPPCVFVSILPVRIATAAAIWLHAHRDGSLHFASYDFNPCNDRHGATTCAYAHLRTQILRRIFNSGSAAEVQENWLRGRRPCMCLRNGVLALHQKLKTSLGSPPQSTFHKHHVSAAAGPHNGLSHEKPDRSRIWRATNLSSCPHTTRIPRI